MAVTKADWEAIEAALVADMKKGVYIGSYTIEGTTYSYRGLDELKRFLEFVRSQIGACDGANPSGGRLNLVRFADL